MPDQLYYFANGRMWLYRGSALVSEDGLSQMNAFETRCNQMNINNLQTKDEIDRFTSVQQPYADFPSDLWESLNFKTRVLCPMPSE
jgi:hypothetical protein